MTQHIHTWQKYFAEFTKAFCIVNLSIIIMLGIWLFLKSFWGLSKQRVAIASQGSIPVTRDTVFSDDLAFGFRSKLP